MISSLIVCLNTIRFYIILKLDAMTFDRLVAFEYYTFLHHSQTGIEVQEECTRLNTIRFYIILKPANSPFLPSASLNTIRFYIILKLENGYGEFTPGLNTIRFYIILKQFIW